ncbi:transposase [Streptomyces sp. NPDC059837]|uniref:transposase n=1 Tax=unclassified Streptomyces TaxID=2593676 RepID=UPI00338FFD86
MEFSKSDCTRCPALPQCTCARGNRVNSCCTNREIHKALHRVRSAREATEGKEQDAMRADVEGATSQAVRAFGLRGCCYRAIDKARLQHTLTAAAISIACTDAWFTGTPHASS